MEGEGAGADRLLDALEGVVAVLAEEDGADEDVEESAARTRAARAGDAAAMYESGGDDFSSDAQAMLTRVSATLDRTLGGAGARARAGAGLRAAPADSVAPAGGDVVVAAAAAEAAEALVSAMRRLDARPDPAGIPRARAPLGRSVDDSDAGERMRVLQQLRADYEVSTSTRPARVPTAPPSWAEVMYKVVAVTGGDDGGAAERYLSVYDGATEYRVGQTMLSSLGAAGAAGHSGGLYVSRTIAECIARDADGFPQDSALIGAPKRAVLRVLAWNVDRQRLPQRYGCVRVPRPPWGHSVGRACCHAPSLTVPTPHNKNIPCPGGTVLARVALSSTAPAQPQTGIRNDPPPGGAAISGDLEAGLPRPSQRASAGSPHEARSPGCGCCAMRSAASERVRIDPCSARCDRATRELTRRP